MPNHSRTRVKHEASCTQPRRAASRTRRAPPRAPSHASNGQSSFASDMIDLNVPVCLATAVSRIDGRLAPDTDSMVETRSSLRRHDQVQSLGQALQELVQTSGVPEIQKLSRFSAPFLPKFLQDFLRPSQCLFHAR